MNCYLLKDTIMFKNLSVISRDSNIRIENLLSDEFSIGFIKKSLKDKHFFQEGWKVKLIKELIEIKEGQLYSSFDYNETFYAENNAFIFYISKVFIWNEWALLF